MNTTKHTALELDEVEAGDIAKRWGLRMEDLEGDLIQANEFADGARSARDLFSSYCEQYAQDQESEGRRLRHDDQEWEDRHAGTDGHTYAEGVDGMTRGYWGREY